MSSILYDSDDSSATTLGNGNGNGNGHSDAQIQYEDSPDDDVLIRERDGVNNIINNNHRRETISQEVRGIFNLLDNSSNNGVEESKQEESKQEELTTGNANTNSVTPSQSAKLPRHPAKDRMLTSFPDAAIQFFKAIDDCGAASVTQASDKCAPKANAWSHALDVCHGGGAEGGGSMARFGFQAISKPSAFKKKAIDYWSFGIENEDLVLPQIYEYCKRQHAEYTQAKEMEKQASTNQRAEAERIQHAMIGYQTSVGARPEGAPTVELPPAARGQEGGGRGQHSTNVTLGEPSIFAYAHLRSNQNQELSPLSGTSNNNNSSNSSNNTNVTPGRHTPPRNNATPARGTATIHNTAMQQMGELGGDLRAVLGTLVQNRNSGTPGSRKSKRESRIEDLERLSKKLKEDALLYKDLGMTDKCESTMLKYSEASQKLQDLLNPRDDQDSENA